MVPGTVNFPISNIDNTTRPLSVTVQSILGQNTLEGTVALNPSDFVALIDSTVPELWLPLSTCDSFVTAFGLIYDHNTGLYLVNEKLHPQLLSLNPSITISLGPYGDTGTSEDIDLPYSAFDLQVSGTYGDPARYFPIRIATDESQNTLGRVFLQEAYLTVDRTRGNFSVAQATHAYPLPAKDIVAILPPWASPASAKRTLSPGAIAGIVIGPVVVIIFVFAFFFIRRRRHRDNASTTKAEEQPAVVDSEYPED